jgi:quercetin dioxygenase-like cupin family protein
MKQAALAVVAALSLVAGGAFAQGSSEVFDFNNEVMKGDQRAGFTLKQMVKTPNYTAGAIALKEEIKMHRHQDGSHVIYIVSGRGTAILDGKAITLKPGTVVHIPKGSSHNIKAEGGEMQILDFAQPPFDPAKMEWIK